jgi:hypothetical protein
MADNNQNLRQLSNCLNQASSLINSFLSGRSDEQHTNPSVERAQQLSQQQRAEHGRLESANTQSGKLTFCKPDIDSGTCNCTPILEI